MPITSSLLTRWICVSAALVILFATPATAADDTPDGLAYRIEASLDPVAQTVSAVATIRIPPTLIGTGGEIDLDLHSAALGADDRPNLSVIEVLAPDGTRLPAASAADPELLRVTLPQLPAASTSLQVRYSVRMDPRDLDSVGYYIFPATGPRLCWYPNIVGPDGASERFRDFDVTLEHPTAWTLLTSGAAAQGESNASSPSAGSKRVRLYARHVEGFAVILGEGFVLHTIDAGGVPVTAFADSVRAPAFQEVAARTAEAVDFYRDTYGFFPVPHLGIVQGFERAAGGYPLPNVFMIHLRNLEPDFVAWITAHELGHYYWGLRVLDDSERLGWLTLANGIWADQLYMAERHGLDLDEQWRVRGNGDWIMDCLRAMIENREQRLGLDRDEARELGFDYNSLIRHGKAATGLFLQARLIGTDRFLELQRSLLKEYRFRPLPEEEFIDRLEEAGADGAREFFAAWRRGDARIDFDIDTVNDSTIVIRRTGNVPYPLEVAVVSTAGTQRHTIDRDAEVDTLEVDSTNGVEVQLDPDGVIPMWNSTHAGMRSLFVEAMFRGSLTEPFLVMGRDHLQRHPDDARVRLLLAHRLFALARYQEVVELASPVEPCDSSDTCWTAIIVARAFRRTGRADEGLRLLESVQNEANDFGLERAWERARREWP
jgi:hypothetical protein